MLQEYDDYFLEEDKIVFTAIDLDILKPKNAPKTEATASPPKVSEKSEIPFMTNEELPETELYFGGDLCENETEHNLRMIRYSQREEMDRLGMSVSSGSVIIKKDNSNMVGISIGGGAPFCPCLYIVQVFDGTPVAKDGTLQSGDELLGVGGVAVKGKTKVEVAKMIQTSEGVVSIHYNKLHANHAQGETLDIALKKIKHRLVENMSSRTADALGFSRAILCNDSLVKRLQELEGTEIMYRGLVDHCKRVLKAHYNVSQTMQIFGTEFCTMSIREPQPRASEAYRAFGEMHRNLEKDNIQMIKTLKPVIANFGTYLNKAIPDTKLTVSKYADAKFAYLSYCLKVKEMDDEEQSFSSIQEPLYRVETGNYEYRLILRCRQEARVKFAKLRTDVLEKIELLEAKHAQNLAENLKKILEGLAKYSENAVEKFESTQHLFPIEVDLKSDAFEYRSNQTFTSEVDETDDVIQGEEAREVKQEVKSSQLLDGLSDASTNLLASSSSARCYNGSGSNFDDLSFLNDIAQTTQPATSSQPNFDSFMDSFADFKEVNLNNKPMKSSSLLTDLGMDEIDLAVAKSEVPPQSKIDDNTNLLLASNSLERNLLTVDDLLN